MKSEVAGRSELLQRAIEESRAIESSGVLAHIEQMFGLVEDVRFSNAMKEGRYTRPGDFIPEPTIITVPEELLEGTGPARSDSGLSVWMRYVSQEVKLPEVRGRKAKKK